MVLTCATVAQSAFAAPPIIDSQWVTDVSSSNATLNARINSNGLLTKYKLQIDTTGNFKFFQTDSCPLHPPEVGCLQVIIPGEPQPAGLVQPPEMTLFGGTVGQPVEVNLNSIGAVLQPETTYHFRAIAANGPGIVEGPDLTFTTPSLGAPPFSEPEPPREEEPAEEPPVEELPSQEERDSPQPPSETDTNPLGPDSSSSTSPVPTVAQNPVARKKHRKPLRRRGDVAVAQARRVG